MFHTATYIISDAFDKILCKQSTRHKRGEEAEVSCTLNWMRETKESVLRQEGEGNVI